MFMPKTMGTNWHAQLLHEPATELLAADGTYQLGAHLTKLALSASHHVAEVDTWHS